MDLHESLAAASRSRGKARRPRNEMQKNKREKEIIWNMKSYFNAPCRCAVCVLNWGAGNEATTTTVFLLRFSPFSLAALPLHSGTCTSARLFRKRVATSAFLTQALAQSCWRTRQTHDNRAKWKGQWAQFGWKISDFSSTPLSYCREPIDIDKSNGYQGNRIPHSKKM